MKSFVAETWVNMPGTLTIGIFWMTGLLTGETKSIVALLPCGATTQLIWNTRTSPAAPWGGTLLRRIIRHLYWPGSSARNLTVRGTWAASTNDTVIAFHKVVQRHTRGVVESFHADFVGKFILIPVEKAFLELVEIWQSYCHDICTCVGWYHLAINEIMHWLTVGVQWMTASVTTSWLTSVRERQLT